MLNSLNCLKSYSRKSINFSYGTHIECVDNLILLNKTCNVRLSFQTFILFCLFFLFYSIVTDLYVKLEVI